MPTDAETGGTDRNDGHAYPPRGTGAQRIGAVGWDDVAEHVRRVRSLRRQTQTEFADEIGLSVRIVGALESGTPRRYQPETLHRVESALGWAHGSLVRVVEGGRPIVDVDPHFARIRDAWPRLPGEARAMLADLAGRAVDGS